MGRRRKTTFGEVTTTRAELERGATLCPSCRRPIGPGDQPSFVRSLGGGAPTLATMRCGRCGAELTVHFLEQEAAG